MDDPGQARLVLDLSSRSPLGVLLIALVGPWMLLSIRWLLDLVRSGASVHLLPAAGIVRFRATRPRFWGPARDDLDVPLSHLVGASAPRLEVRRRTTPRETGQIEGEELWLTPRFKLGHCSTGQAAIAAAQGNAALARWTAEQPPAVPSHQELSHATADGGPPETSAEPIYRASGRERRRLDVPNSLRFAFAPPRMRIAALLFCVFAVAVFAFGVDCLRGEATDRHPVMGVVAMLYALNVLFVAASIASGGVKLTIDPVAKTLAFRRRVSVFSRTTTFSFSRISLAHLANWELHVSPDIRCDLSALWMTEERARWVLPKIHAIFAGWSEVLADSHPAEPSEPLSLDDGSIRSTTGSSR